MAQAVGHDIDYIALTGALHAIGGKDAPLPPFNLLGDYGGGAMLLAFGVVSALLEARASGRGQVVDAAMTDGAALMMAMTIASRRGVLARPTRDQSRSTAARRSMASTAAPTASGSPSARSRRASYAALLAGLGLEAGGFADRWNPRLAGDAGAHRGGLRRADARRMGGALRRRRRLRRAGARFDEAPRHPHAVARGAFVAGEGAPQPAPAPRFSRTQAEVGAPPHAPGADGELILCERGFTAERIEALKRCGAL